MTNPIQTVLDAEEKARQQIDQAAQAAQSRILQAQQQAREIINRNEKRTARAAKHYEALCQRDLAEKIDAMVDEAEKNLDQFTHISDDDCNQIVDAVFTLLSPRPVGKSP